MPEQRQRGRRVPPTSVAGGLPSTAIQRQVAGAVHQAICALLKTDGSDRCAWYAATAANLMPHLTGNKYTINSGSLTVATEPNGNGFTFDAANPQIADAEFHSLLVRDHGNGRFEAADLAARQPLGHELDHLGLARGERVAGHVVPRRGALQVLPDQRAQLMHVSTGSINFQIRPRRNSF
jgi:hypothetical protein